MSKIERDKGQRLSKLTIIVILLFLLALTIFIHHINHKSQISSKTANGHLHISREYIYQNPEKANKLLAKHNITNVRIITKEDFQQLFKKSSHLLNRAKRWRSGS